MPIISNTPTIKIGSVGECLQGENLLIIYSYNELQWYQMSSIACFLGTLKN